MLGSFFAFLLHLTAVSLAFETETKMSNCQIRDSEIFCKDIKNISTVLDILVNEPVTITTLILENCQDFDDSYKDPRFSALYNLQVLKLNGCRKGTKILENFNDFHSLRSLTIRNSFLEKFELKCATKGALESLDLSENKIEQFTFEDSECKTVPILRLNLSSNNFRKFNLKDLEKFPDLKVLILSHNEKLSELIPTSSVFPQLETLDLSHNPSLKTLCSPIFWSFPKISWLRLDQTPQSRPLGAYKLLPDSVPDCTCELLNHHEDQLSCKLNGSSASIPISDTLSTLECAAVIINSPSDNNQVFAGDEVTLDCDWSGNPSPSILWLTPNLELIIRDPDPRCPAVDRALSLCNSSLCPETSYSSKPGHFRILDNGSLVIDKFGWRDRGDYKCHMDNSLGNFNRVTRVQLDPNYRHVIYLWSLLYGLVTALGFLAFCLLGKLIHHLAWNYGCCYCWQCCTCCHVEPPPKIKRLAATMESIEQYRIGQLEKLRENYTQQSQKIRDNYSLQLERLRETYTSQKKEEAQTRLEEGEGAGGVREQYWDNVNRVREYSNMQLTKLHENYIFQRQRLRKFSVQNYVKIRETGKYTQKTLNRVIESMPTLTEMTNCRQGAPDWEEEEEEDIPKMELMMLREEDKSLYFTPDGSPHKDVANVDLTSPLHGGAKRKSHKRMVSNLSNFFPFWWGMGQSDHGGVTTGTTVAVIESDTSRHEDEGLGEESVTLVINTEDKSSTSSIYVKS